MHLHWNPEVSECLKSGNKLKCSDFILAVGHNAARKWLQAESAASTVTCFFLFLINIYPCHMYWTTIWCEYWKAMDNRCFILCQDFCLCMLSPLQTGTRSDTRYWGMRGTTSPLQKPLWSRRVCSTDRRTTHQWVTRYDDFVWSLLIYRLVNQQLKNLFFFDGLWKLLILKNFKLSSCLVCKE